MSHSAHITHLLPDYLDDALPPDERRAVEVHVQACAACRAERDHLETVLTKIAALPRAIEPPHDLWPGIAARLSEPALEDAQAGLTLRRNGTADRLPQTPPRRRRHRRPAWRLGAALLAVVLAVGAGAFWVVSQLFQPTWEVARLEGTPRIGERLLAGTGALRQGQWLETDARSRAALTVGAIGNVEVEPNTRLRLLATQPTDHRLALEQGTIRARIWAPPRLFFVETPSALAIDLGCAYTLEVDSTGGSLLHVTSGYVALAYEERTAIVPAGFMGLTRPSHGPGTPFNEDATASFRRALNAIDFEHGGTDALTTLLAEARPADATTLWYLLYRVDRPDRERVYDRLIALHPPPEGVTRDGMLRADPRMIETWQLHLGLDVDTGWSFWKKKKPRLPS